MTDNFQELVKDMNCLIKKTADLNRKNKKKPTYGHMVIKRISIWNQDLLMQAKTEQCSIVGTKEKITVNLELYTQIKHPSKTRVT